MSETETSNPTPFQFYLSGYCEASQKAMTSSLTTLAIALTEKPDAKPEDIKVEHLTYQRIMTARKVMAESLAVTYVNHIIVCMRGLIRAFGALKLMPKDDVEFLATIPNVKGTRVAPGRNVSQDEIAALFKAIEDTRIEAPTQVRDKSILALMFGCGLRRSEVCKLNLSDVAIHCGRLRVHGKGNKERIVYASGKTLQYLKDWMHYRNKMVDGPLFPTLNSKTMRPMTPQNLNRIFNELIEASGVEDMTTHDARRTWVSNMLDAGVDLATVQRAAGHASPATTAKYDRRKDDQLKAAAEKVVMP